MGCLYLSLELSSTEGDHSGTFSVVLRSRCGQTLAGGSVGRAAFANSSGEESSGDQTGFQCWAFLSISV